MDPPSCDAAPLPLKLDKALAKRACGRACSFVVVPFCAEQLTGADGASQLRELVTLGEATVQLLLSTKAKGVCPRVLLCGSLGSPSGGHELACYADAVSSEQQLPLHLHIAAHEANGKIGSGKGYNPDAFADMLVPELHRAGATPGLLAKRGGLRVTLHICRCADLLPGAPPEESAEGEAEGERNIALRETLLRQHTFMGRLHAILSGRGYSSLRVDGYSGLYMTLASKKGAVVSVGGKSVTADKAMFSVMPHRVVIPQLYAGGPLPVWRSQASHLPAGT